MSKGPIVTAALGNRPVSMKWVRYSLGFQMKEIQMVRDRLRCDGSDLASDVVFQLNTVLSTLEFVRKAIGEEVPHDLG